jgi:hypothetical protein
MVLMNSGQSPPVLRFWRNCPFVEMNRENQAGNAAIIAGFLMNLGQDLAISGRMVLVERKIGFIRSLAP